MTTTLYASYGTTIHSGEGTVKEVLIDAIKKSYLLNDLSIKNEDLSGVDFSNAILRGAVFVDCNLNNCNFKQLNAVGVRFERCTLDYANFIQSDLSHSHFKRCFTNNATFAGARLYNITASFGKFIDCNFTDAYMGTAILDSNFYNSNFTRAYLVNSQIAGEFNSCNFTGANIYRLAEVNTQTTFYQVNTSGIRTNVYGSLITWARQFVNYRSRNEFHEIVRDIRESLNNVFRLSLLHKYVKSLSICTECDIPGKFKGKHSGPIAINVIICSCCNKCYDCCECVICPNCDGRFMDADNFCSNCENCTGCCECSYCSNCGDRGNIDICTNCDVCNNCCECEDKAGVEFFTNKPVFHSCKRNQLKLNRSKRFLSAEIEVAAIDDDFISDVVRKWRGSIVHDGSLPSTGFEINTAPASGDLFINQVLEICTALNKGRATTTTACGLHVHIDARDYSYYDLRRLVKAYAKIEPFLYGMVPRERGKSRYCMPCGKNYMEQIDSGKIPYKAAKSSIFKATYNQELNKNNTIKMAKESKYNDARYSALNLHSWFYRGTIECRLFNNTTNFEKITNWGKMWAFILDYVASTSDEVNDKHVSDMEMKEFLFHMVGNDPEVKNFIEERYTAYGQNKL